MKHPLGDVRKITDQLTDNYSIRKLKLLNYKCYVILSCNYYQRTIQKLKQELEKDLEKTINFANFIFWQRHT